MNIDEDFAEFVGARWGSLYRLAYLLTASPTAAEDLLQTTLEKAYVAWPRIGRMEYAEAYARRMLANALVSSRRRMWNREQPWDELPRRPGTPPSCRPWTGTCCGPWCAAAIAALRRALAASGIGEAVEESWISTSSCELRSTWRQRCRAHPHPTWTD